MSKHECTCHLVDEKYWTTHYGAVEPGSMWEPNPDCRVHFPERLRDRPATLRPRVVIRGGKFWTEYFGPHVQDECGQGFPTLEGAIKYANQKAKDHERWMKRAA